MVPLNSPNVFVAFDGDLEGRQSCSIYCLRIPKEPFILSYFYHVIDVLFFIKNTLEQLLLSGPEAG